MQTGQPGAPDLPRILRPQPVEDKQQEALAANKDAIHQLKHKRELLYVGRGASQAKPPTQPHCDGQTDSCKYQPLPPWRFAGLCCCPGAAHERGNNDNEDSPVEEEEEACWEKEAKPEGVANRPAAGEERRRRGRGTGVLEADRE